MKFSNISLSNYSEVSKIYLEGIATGMATFETSAPTWEDWDKNHLQSGRIVLQDQGQILGWAALSPVSSRCVYEGVAEVSVYVSSNARGQGVGKRLLNKLTPKVRIKGSGLYKQVSFGKIKQVSLYMRVVDSE